jgi:pimeloyl-ACP methyl ester carboxylesterase
MGIARAIVVGHSWAGALALNLALDHADLVAGLALLAPLSHPWPGAGISWYYRPATWPVLGRFLVWTVTTPAGLLLMKPTLSVVFAPQSPPAGYLDRSRIPLVLRPRPFRTNAEDVAGLYRFVARQSRRYGAIRAPTAIVSGDADTIVWTNLHSRSLEREIPGDAARRAARRRAHAAPRRAGHRGARDRGRGGGGRRLTPYPFAFAHAATSAWVANQTFPFALAWRMSSSRIHRRER